MAVGGNSPAQMN
ncbi:hypothetical protein LEMLEM_LOCUS1643 [Lemmus lemmus]